MAEDINAARIYALEHYLANEANGGHINGDDAKITTMFTSWYAEPFMHGSRTKTVALAKRMLVELRSNGKRLWAAGNPDDPK